MKTRFPSLLLAALAFAPAFPSAHAATAPDRAAELLRQRGHVPVAQVGPHVATGTFRVQVAAKLGRPDLTLADGTWLYRGRRVTGSAAAGTLVIRFEAGRVSAIALATDAVVAALRADPTRGAPLELVATR